MADMTEDCLLTLRQVRGRTGLAASTIYRRVSEGRFPVPVRLGDTLVRWRQSELEAWIASLEHAVDLVRAPGRPLKRPSLG